MPKNKNYILPPRLWTLKKELARFLARDPEVIVDGLARLLGQFNRTGRPVFL